MTVHRPILQSKLARPYTARTLPRIRLNAQLGAITHKKLALIIAGAGYGKSTLAAQTIAGLDADTIWYNLDPSDGDLSTFMAHLLAGVQSDYPEFGIDLWPQLAVAAMSRESRRKLLVSFMMDVERHLAHPLIVVLDDFHRVRDCPEILDAMEWLLGRMPKTLHWVIISRREPGLKLSRYRATTDIVELDEADLSFNEDEIKRLYGDLFGIQMSPPQIDGLYAKTGGWAAALLLFFNALKGCPSRSACDALFRLDKPRRFIFEYLEENIVGQQPDAVQAFMMRSSLLSQLDPEICDRVCDTRDAWEILSNLSRSHLLTFPCNEKGDGFQYHPLLKAFLRDRLARLYGVDALRRHHFDIAKVMEERRDIQSALHHYIAGEHYGAVCRLFAGLVLIDFKDIPITFLKQTFDRIPLPLMARNAQLLYIRAKVMSVGGEIRRAMGDFQTALALFREDDDADGIANCLKEIAFHHYLTGNVTGAVRELEHLWDRPHKDPFFPLEVAGFLILFSAITGDVDAADDYCDAAMKTFAVSDIFDAAFIRAWFRLCHAYRFHVAGNFRKADALNQQALDTFLQMELDNFLPITYFQSALTAYYRADPSRGCEYAQKGLSVAVRQGVFDNQYAWLLYGRALNRFGMGMGDQALSDADAAFDLFKAYENTWGQALAQECRGMIHGRIGDWQKAVDAYEDGLALLAASDLRTAPSQGSLVLGLAEVMLESGRPGPAGRVSERDLEHVRVSQFDRFRFHLLRARIETENSGPDRAVRDVEAALAIAAANGYEKWIMPRRQWLIPLLVECHHRNKSREFIECLLIRAGRDADTALCRLRNRCTGHLGRAADRLLKALPHSVPAPLDIHCLGRFSVAIGDRLIPTQQWRSGKATLLFKYLAVRYERGWVPKEKLLELAWPGEDAAVSTPRLHVALNALRKLFEPDLKRGVPSAYILRNGDGYRLEIGQEGRIDALDFIKAADAARAFGESDPERALALGLKAASLYRGSLLEENPYDEWLVSARESLREKYLQCLAGIIRVYENREAWHHCIEFSETYLKHDRFAEPVYRKLMVMYAKAGNLPRVTQTFETCKAHITDELDCPLSHSTLKLYDKIKQQAP